ncbi:hypothetical protein SDC9_27264 [bioreactor metagenome]|uniref:Uncharacterized protein n=1 Tax=bioreactor metagenome TaxID=1076179 RepID=A0A644UQP2_9ZZZZ
MANTSSTVEIVNITPSRRWSLGEKVRLISMAPVSMSVAVTYRSPRTVQQDGGCTASAADRRLLRRTPDLRLSAYTAAA